ncbi:sodium channel protein Nach-like [Galleria mellonella]|uniref:Sodium channel protein Nach-like n=1 Tax=Galleria mellonella TaxID=7137 RepID=A0ABM3MNF9_GALME|nr:sodium channel protein Nach-like [Galleria mellonella]
MSVLHLESTIFEYILIKMVLYSIDKTFGLKEKNVFKKNNLEKKHSKVRWFFVKFKEFCKRTDLHGYKYIVMEDLTLVERSCWAVAVLMSTAIAIYFVVTAYRWYARNPIVTVIESTQGAIWDMPFPAVTICDLNIISRKAARRFANNLTLPANVSADFVFNTVRVAPMLHSTYIIGSEQKEDLRKLQSILDLNNVSITMLFRELSPAKSCSRLVQRCMWKNTIYRCNELFQNVFTTMSLCCAFNYFAIMENGNLSSKSRNPSNPRRVASCGYQTALTVILNTNPDDYYSAFVASQGLLVFIDDAYNIPDMDTPVRMVNPSTEVLIALSPESTYATPGIRSFRPEQRQCYYYDELQIGLFRQYSFHNCMAFLKVELFRRTCECVPYYFPMKGQYRVCNFNDLDCLESVLNPTERYQNESQYGQTFQCLPECEHFDYHLEVALGELANNIQLNGLPFYKDINLENRSLLNVFFNDLVATKYRRDVYLNWQNILAAFGGLLSLMLGFTLISGFDLILFFTFTTVYKQFFKRVEYKKNALSNSKKHKINRINVKYYPKKNTWLEKSSGIYHK